MELRKKFLAELKDREGKVQALAVAVKLPTGAIEIIVNTQELDSKIQYYLTAYDDEFKLHSNPNIQIVSFMMV